MCTLLARLVNNNLYLGMNRDDTAERIHTEWVEEDGMMYPKDPTAGGTWLAIKENGDIAALLNGDGENPNKVKSRGDIVLRSLRGERIDLHDYAPFQLLEYTHGADKPFSVTEWTGNGTSQYQQNVGVTLASSSYGHRKIKEDRILERFNEVDSIMSIRSILTDHEHGPSAKSLCMHGSSSHTLSSHLVSVNKGGIYVYETMSNPCFSDITLIKQKPLKC